MYDIFSAYKGFQWDKGNSQKNAIKHGVSKKECEQAFFNLPFIVSDDIKHSIVEKRYYALGKTDNHRKLFIVFTIRKNLIRIISTRDMNRKERKTYIDYEKTT
jgi:uncharacterized protein